MEDARPLISIIIPTRNRAYDLDRCLGCLVGLTFSNKEIIVIDGASEDDTRLVLEKYQHIAAWISERDRGVYDALNKGCQIARGRYLYFLGSDDQLLDNLEAVAKHLKDPFTVYYGDVILSHSKKLYDGVFTTFKLARTNISHQAIFYPRRIFENACFSLKYPIQSDWEFNMRLWGNSRYRFQYIDLPIASFAEDGLSSIKQDDTFNHDYLMLIRQHFPRHVYIARKMLLSLLSVVKIFLPQPLINKVNKLKLRL